ncbi:MAG: winged helix-turn-helix transcriptional regulator [archaeon]
MSELEKESVEFFTQNLRIKGLDESLSRITATLFLEPGEISMEELAEKTGYSLATISTRINLLDQTGFIKKSHKPGSKKILLCMEKDILSSLKDSMIARPLKIIAHVKEKLPAILEKHRGKAKSEEDKKRLKILDDYYKQVLRMEFIINEVMKHLEELQSKELKA